MNIIIVHGLYMHGVVMRPLSQRLRKMGYQTQVISYNTVAINSQRVFNAIDTALSDHQPNILVGHSLGGLMIKHYLAARRPSSETISHVVAIGSPLTGSSIAEQLKKIGLGVILGNSPQFGLNYHQDQWQHPQKLGSIAGTLPIGLRPLLLGRGLISDGTVTVKETQIEGMTDHIKTRNTHTSLIYRHDVADQIDHFIRHDHFNHHNH
ncbi:esterase/lipase family protein [Vibrio olivae]|uniref:Esterase/lipase family protein n=1 Tax=Vibrio olivae TaxID=1243002 RepID=A0ABV5HM28_9VIBR